MSGKPKIGTWAAWRAMTAVHNAGGDTSTVLKQAGLTEDIVSQTNHRIDYRQNLQFFEACATHLQNPHFGLDVGNELDILDIGPVAFCMASSANLGDGIKNYAKFSQLVTDGTVCTVHTVDGNLVFERFLLDKESTKFRQFSDFVASGFIKSMSDLIAEPLAPMSIYLPYEHSGPVERYEQMLGGPVTFGVDKLGLVVSAQKAQMPLRSRDDSLRRAIHAHCESLLESLTSKSIGFTREVVTPLETELTSRTSSVQRLKDELREKSNELERLVGENAGFKQREAKKDLAISRLEQRVAENIRQTTSLREVARQVPAEELEETVLEQSATKRATGKKANAQ